MYLLIKFLFVAAVVIATASTIWFNIFNQTVIGTGDQITECRPAEAVKHINLSGLGNLYLEQSNRPYIKVTADDNILPYLITTITNNVLNIYVKPGFSVSSKKSINYTIGMPYISSLSTSGSTALIIPSFDSSKNIEIHTSGSSTISATIRTPLLKITGSGSSNIKIQGIVPTQKVHLSGGNTYNAENVITNHIKIHMSGAAKATLVATELIEGSASGATKLFIKAPQQRITVSGVSHISTF